jgi:hypothetical protein
MARAPTRVGPINNIVGVGWGSGIFLHILADAVYDAGTLGTRTGVVELTQLGRESGGRILGQRMIHQPEITNVSPATTRVRALLAFSKPLKDQRAAYTLRLTGSIAKVDPALPPNSQALFCGVQTTTSNYGPIFTQPTPGNPSVPQFFRSVTITTSSPAGSSSTSYTQGPIADLTVADVGKGAYTISGSSSELWYRDAFGNYVNTHRPCSDLHPGDPPVLTPQRVEGWSYIETQVWPQKFYTIALPDPAQWDFDFASDHIIVPTSPLAFGGFWFRTIIPQNIVGVNADLQPIFDDLAAATYEFALQNAQFNELPKIRPPDPYKVPVPYPLTPQYVVFNMVATAPAPYRGYHPPKVQYPGTFSAGGLLEARFPAGVLPSPAIAWQPF